MNIKSINNYNINKINSPNFKGKVSTEFIQYVSELNKDCFETNPSCKTAINNVCNSILNRAKTVMERCFHSMSVLSIDKTRASECDAIIIPNDIITKYAIDRVPMAVGYVEKKESSEPIIRLRQLRACINGDIKHYSCFLEAYAVNESTIQNTLVVLDEYADRNCDKEVLLKKLQNWIIKSRQSNVDKPLIEILKRGENYQGALQEILSLLEFGQNHVDILATYYDYYKKWSIINGQIISELKQNVEKLINHQDL